MSLALATTADERTVFFVVEAIVGEVVRLKVVGL
jgi:hypothetical protein